MQDKVHGIVLRTVRYGDTSVIVDMYTREEGRVSVIASSVRKRRGGGGMSLWQPMSMVEVRTDNAGVTKRLPKVKEAAIRYVYNDLPYSPIKSSIAIFLAEFLCAALREEGENKPLFAFLENSLQWLDMTDDARALANYHIVFITQLSRYIGIWPNTDNTGNYFDMQAGTYTHGQPMHSYFLRPEEARYIRVLFRTNYAVMRHLRFSRSGRMRILDVLNTYFRLHVPAFPELRSISVLHELFD